MNIWKGVTSLGGHTRPDCNARYDVRIKLVETWFFVSYMTGECWETFRDGRIRWLVESELIQSRVWNTRFWLVVPPSSDYYYSHQKKKTNSRYWKMQTPRLVLTLTHLRALHDVLRKTFLKVTNNEMSTA